MDHAANLIRAIASLAWPVAALVAVIIFRAQITGLLQAMRRIKAGPVQLDLWERKTKEVRVEVASTETEPVGLPTVSGVEEPSERASLTDELGELAQRSPVTAVREAHDRVRDELRRILREAGTPGPVHDADAAVTLAAAAARRGLITNQTMFAVEGLTTLRNLSEHGDGQVSPDRALSYLVTADGALYAIRQNVRTARARAAR